MCLLLLLGFGLLLITFVDLDRFREPIAAELSKATGLKVELESLHLEFTHGLGFRCNGLRFFTRDGSKDLFYAENVYLLAELKPLFKKQVKIKKATLVNPVVKIDLASPRPKITPTPLPEESGRNDDSGRTPDQKPSPTPSPAAVPSEDLEPIDQQKVTVKNLEKILKGTDLRVQNIEIKNAQILLLQKSSESAPAHTIPISVSFLLNLNRPATGRMETRIDSLQLKIDPLHFQGKGRIDSDPESPLHVVADLTSSPIPIAELKEIKKHLPNLSFLNQLKEGRLDKIAMHLELPIQDVENIDSLQKNARMDLKVQISDAVYQTGEGRIALSRLNGEGKWKDSLLTQKFSGELLGGEFQETGKIRFSSTTGKKRLLTVESDISFKELNLAQLGFPDKVNRLPSQGKAFGSFKLIGPVSFSKNATDLSGLQWTGSAELENLAWTNPDFPQKMARATLRIQKGTQALTIADVETNQLTVQGIPFKKAWGLFRITPETLQLVSGKIRPENGEIRMTGKFNSIQETYSLSIQGDRLKAEDFSRQSAFGSVKFSGKFGGRLRSTKHQGKQSEKLSPFTRGLSGNLDLNITDGNIQKIEGIKALLVLLNPSTALQAGREGLEYKFVRGHFKIRNGLVLTDDLQMDGPQLKMFVAGKTDLPTGKVRAEIKAVPLQMIDGLVKAVPLLGELLTGGEKGGVLETYFKVTGTLDKPKIELMAQKSVIKKPADFLKGFLKAPQLQGKISGN